MRWLSTGLAVCFAVLATGCQRLCQQPAAQAFTSVTQTEWRLAASTDPDIRDKITNVTFLIWTFGTTFQGQIFTVNNNTKDDVPVKTFIYNPNGETKTMVIQFFGRGSVDQDGNATQGPSEGTTTFTYDLGKTLTLYDSQRGYQYDFVPFTGSVTPDATCTFIR